MLPCRNCAICAVSQFPVRCRTGVVTVIGSLRLDFGSLVDGVWTYKDPEQVRIVLAVKDVLKWDITPLDTWLFGREHWRNYPRVRQHLIGLRERLTRAVQSETNDSGALSEGISEYFRETRRLALRMDNLPDSLRQTMMAVGPIKKPKIASKLDSNRVIRIQQAYRNLVQSGQKYGAQTTLARQHGVSVAVVRKILQSTRMP